VHAEEVALVRMVSEGVEVAREVSGLAVVLTRAKASLMADDGGDGVFEGMETSETVVLEAAGAVVASAVAMG
jgi:hypothetical protein